VQGFASAPPAGSRKSATGIKNKRSDD